MQQGYVRGMDPKSHWDGRYASIAVEDLNPEPAAILLDNVGLLDAALADGRKRALDVAGGTGRNALWLAERGFEAAIVDVSPVGLDVAERWATQRNVGVATLTHDLEADGMPGGTWDLIVITLFLNRDIVLSVSEYLESGGLAMFAQPTVTNLERHEHPSERFLLKAGEIAEMANALSTTCEIIEATEDWRGAAEDDQAHTGRLIVRKGHSS